MFFLVTLFFLLFFFFFKQETAYEMRISDWSSDVCSSDLPVHVPAGRRQRVRPGLDARSGWHPGDLPRRLPPERGRAEHLQLRARRRRGTVPPLRRLREIGRASCRERVCQYV